MTLNFIRNEFFERHDPTIDDSYTTTIVVDEVPWQIEILDTAGQEEYRGLWVEHAVSQGEAFICTYAINSTRSFLFLPKILNLIANVKSGHDISAKRTDSVYKEDPMAYPFPFVVAGNKVDLSDQRTVMSDDGMRMATMTGGLFFECSAKTGAKITNVFTDLIRSVAKLRREKASQKADSKFRHRRYIPNIGFSNISKGLIHADIVAAHASAASYPPICRVASLDIRAEERDETSRVSIAVYPPDQPTSQLSQSFRPPEDVLPLENAHDHHVTFVQPCQLACPSPNTNTKTSCDCCLIN